MSHFISDCRTRMIPDINQNMIASQLSNIMEESRMELMYMKIMHVNDDGVAYEGIYLGIHIIMKLIIKITGRRKIELEYHSLINGFS